MKVYITHHRHRNAWRESRNRHQTLPFRSLQLAKGPCCLEKCHGFRSRSRSLSWGDYHCLSGRLRLHSHHFQYPPLQRQQRQQLEGRWRRGLAAIGSHHRYQNGILIVQIYTQWLGYRSDVVEDGKTERGDERLEAEWHEELILQLYATQIPVKHLARLNEFGEQIHKRRDITYDHF